MMKKSQSGATQDSISTMEPHSDTTPTSPSSPIRTASKSYTLTLHPSQDYKEELVLNPDLFPGLHAGDYIEITPVDGEITSESNSSFGDKGGSIVLQLKRFEAVRGRLEVSILRTICMRGEFNHLRSFMRVYVRKMVAPFAGYNVRYMELSFKDQYISQGEFWRFRSALHGQSIYVGKNISLLGIKARVEEMLTEGNLPILSGIIRPWTKFIFRSGSARLFWLVQLSKEMWDFAEDGDLYHERFLKFAKSVFERWKAKAVHHSLTVVYFSRTFYNVKPAENVVLGEKNVDARVLQRNYDGRYYIDAYKVVIENETKFDWLPTKQVLKQGITDFVRLCGWGIPSRTNHIPRPEYMRRRRKSSISSATSNPFAGMPKAAAPLSPPASPRHPETLTPTVPVECKGYPALAHQGNLLEAINLCLNILDKHFMDRDLSRTGQAIVLFTAGNGVIEVDRALTRITKQRMMDNAIGCDVVSLARAPLHITPLFIFKPSMNKTDVLDMAHPFAHSSLYTVGNNALRSPTVSTELEAWLSRETSNGSDKKSSASAPLPVYNLPHWIHVCFPFHKISSIADADGVTRTKFEPVPENVMFDLMNPQRGCLPITLIHSIREHFEKDKEGNQIRSPSREQMSAWYPLTWDKTVTAYAPRSRTAPSPVMPLPRSPSTSLLNAFKLEPASDRTFPQKRQLSLSSNPLPKPKPNTKPKPKPKPGSKSGAKLQSGRLGTLGIYDLGRAKSLEWGDDHAKSSNESLHALSRSPVDRWNSRVLRGKVGSGLPAKQAIGLGLGYAANPASTWREQLLSTMDMQLRHDSQVFSKPIERPLQDVSTFNDSQSSLTSDGMQQQQSLSQNSALGPTPSQGSGGHGGMRKLNVRNSERAGKGENGKIYTYLMSRKRHTSEDSAREQSGTSIGDLDKAVDEKEKEKDKEKRKISRLKRSTQSMDAAEESATSVLSSSLEKTNMLPWDRRRNFGPGMRVCAPTDTPASPTTTALSSMRLAMASPKAAAEPHRSAFPLNRGRAQSTASSASSNAQPIAKQTSTASFSSEEGATSGGSPKLKDSPLSHMSTLSTSPPRPGLSFSKRAGLRSRKELGHPHGHGSREVGMHRQVTASSRGALSPEPIAYKPPTTPFDLREISSQSYYQNLTHNRRRWSHLFPTGKFSKPTSTRKQTLEVVSETEQRSAGSSSGKAPDETTIVSGETMSIGSSLKNEVEENVDAETFEGAAPLTFEFYRPNWKSLQSPGVLPLTTDYVPDRAELDYNYTENFYTLTLPEQPGDFGYTDYDELILELVCQRLSQDYQLYIDPKEDTMESPKDYCLRRKTYVCTMGHQVHHLEYYPGTREVHVKIYVQRQWVAGRRKHRSLPYKFVLHDPIDEGPIPVELDFDEISPFYNWNQLDNLICGYGDDIRTLIRYRRQIFLLFPMSGEGDELELNKLALSDMEKEDALVAEFQKFIAWIESKVSGDERMDIDVRRRFKVIRRQVKDTADYHGNLVETVLDDELQIVDNKDAWRPVPVRRNLVKVDLLSNKSGRYEWLQLEYDSVYSPYQSYHMQLQWLVASAASITVEFVNVMQKKARTAGLVLRRLPEYCMSTSAIYDRRVPHAFILPKAIHMKYTPKQKPEMFRRLADLAESHLDFLIDSVSPRVSNGPCYTLVHKDAIAVAYFCSDGKIEFIQNRSEGLASEPVKLFHDFSKLCKQVEQSQAACEHLLR